MADLNIYSRGGRLRVEGLRKTLKALEKAGTDTQDMKALMHNIGMIVVNDARPHVPRGASKKLAGDLRAGRGKTKAVVYAGRKSIPYAGVVHYGTPPGYKQPTKWGERTFNRRPQSFLNDALERKEVEIFAKLVEGLGDILDRNNLENNL